RPPRRRGRPVAAAGGAGRHQRPGHRAGALHPVRLLLPGGRPRAADRHDRGDRADAPPQAAHQASIHPPPGWPPPQGRGCGHQRPDWRGHPRMITLTHYLAVAAALFTIGVFGIFVNRKNVIVILMSIEMILLAVNINFVAFSVYLHNVAGQILAMFVLTVAAAEAAVGLAILVTFFRNRGDIAVDDASMMKG